MSIVQLLRGGDRRSTGRADEVARLVVDDPSLLIELVAALEDDDAVVRMRAADALEKASRARHELLAPFKAVLLERVALQEQSEVRWHVAQMLPRLNLLPKERHRVDTILDAYLADRSVVVRVEALQALSDLATRGDASQSRLEHALDASLASDAPALKTRARRIVQTLHPWRRGWGAA